MFLLLACAPETMTSTNRGGAGEYLPRDEGDDSGSTTDTSGADDSGDGGESWTFLVFMNGDNDLERWALADVNEMEVVGSTSAVNIVVQLDRSEDYDTGDGDWTGARRYRVEADENPRAISSPVLADLGEVDSGDPQTVIEFAEWGIDTFPADRVALVLWDHGTGWSLLPGIEKKAISEDYGARSSMSVAGGDVTAVYAAAAEALGRPVDLVGFDACTMMMWEVAWSVADHAEVMVASQDYEDLQGWDYTGSMADLVADPTMSAAELGDSIAFRFHEIPDSTQSVVDLRQLPAFTRAIDELAQDIIAGGNAAELLALSAADAQGFDGPQSLDHDVSDLLSRMATANDDDAVDEAIASALSAADALVISNYNQGGRVKNANGLSIYSPASAQMPPIYARAPWAGATAWDEMIVAAGE